MKNVAALSVAAVIAASAPVTAKAGEVTIRAGSPDNPGFRFQVEIDGEPFLQPVLPGQPFVVEDGESAVITITPVVADAGADGKIGLEDAIHALRVVSGAQNQQERKQP